TDSIPLSPEAQACSKIQVASVAGLLAKAIHNIHTESSVSVLFG
ncbi:MAG: phosphoribosylpyrophosphate synthetase, partial [Okeania sp. SIO3C4]|nr:phosphoribosylpyrophosphate synthetase [Okeania sp. SIO3C4]